MNDQRHEPSEDAREVVARLLEVAGPRPPVPDDVALRVRTAVHADWQREVRARRVRRRAWTMGLAAAACLVAAVAGTSMLRPDVADLPEPPVGRAVVAALEAHVGADLSIKEPGGASWRQLGPGEVVRAGATVRTGRSSQAGIRLGSGVSLRADSHTRFRLVSAFDVAVEGGSVYIDNPPDGEHDEPLTVRTPLGVVRDIGTQFEVRLDPGALRVRVREGTVTVERDRRTDTATSGVELQVREDGTVLSRPIPVSGPDWAWVLSVAGPMEIEGRPLSAFLTWVSREHGWRLAYTTDAAAAAARTVLHGSVAGLSPEDAIGSVLATCGLAHRVEDGTLVIVEQAKEP